MVDKVGKIRRLTVPSTEPVTRIDAKEHLRIDADITVEDNYIDRLIASARDHVEKHTGRAWATANFIWTVEALTLKALSTSQYQFEMPMPYVHDVTEIAYLDDDDVAQTVAISDIDFDQERQRVAIPDTISGHDWRIKFTAGADKGTNDAEIIPEAIQQAIQLLVGDAYENRQAQVQAANITENPAVKSLMTDYRVNWGV